MIIRTDWTFLIRSDFPETYLNWYVMTCLMWLEFLLLCGRVSQFKLRSISPLLLNLTHQKQLSSHLLGAPKALATSTIATSQQSIMLRALQLRSILVTSVSRKAASSAPRTRVAVPKFTKKANLISTWSKKRAWTAESMKKATVVSTRSYSTSMPFRDMNKTELELLMSGNPDNYVLIDVREPDELRHGTIPNAHNLPRTSFVSSYLINYNTLLTFRSRFSRCVPRGLC